MPLIAPHAPHAPHAPPADPFLLTPPHASSRAARAALDRAHTGMVLALGDEIAAETAHPCILPPGTRVMSVDEHTGGSATYRFRRRPPRAIERGDTVLVRLPSPGVTATRSIAWAGRAQGAAREQSVEATVAAIDVRSLTLRLPRDVGTRIPRGATLFRDETFALTAARDRIRELAGGRARLDHGVALTLLGLADHWRAASEEALEAADVWEHAVDGADHSDEVAILASRFPDLSEEQLLAIARVGQQPVAALWGPPGTGKTSTLAAGVAWLSGAAEGKDADPGSPRILVLAPSNRALDEAVLRLARRLRAAPGFREGRLLRVGRRAGRRLTRSYGAAVVASAAAERARRRLLRRLSRRAIRREEQLERREEDLRDLGRFVRCGVEDEVEAAEQERLAQQYARSGARLDRMEERGRNEAAVFGRAWREPARVRRAVERELVAKCQILAATVHHALASRQVREAQWDYVVIDEASMVPAALGYAAATLARRAVWLLGDFRQAAPVVKARTPAARRHLAASLFETSRCYRDVPAQSWQKDGSGSRLALASHVTVLTRQHRMHPDICRLVAPAYGGLLHTDPMTAAERRASTVELPFPQHRRGPAPGVYLLDTSTLRPQTRRGRHESRETPRHVVAIIRLLQTLGRHALLPGAGRVRSIGIVAGYRAQAGLMRRALRRHLPGVKGVRVGTVHAFQSEEVDILILDVVETGGLAFTSWMTAAQWSDEGGRLLTVATSRARERLIIVADCATVQARLGQLRPTPVVARMLRELEETGGAIDIDTIG